MTQSVDTAKKGGFSEAQIAWLETAQEKSAEFSGAAKTLEAKAERLAEITEEIESFREEMQKANEALKVNWKAEVPIGKFYNIVVETSMDWMNGDRDKEIDTVHDLKGSYQVDPEQAKQVQIYHRRLVELQTKMETAKDENGNPVFTAKDIERELWSPLVRADIIPSNAVADKYSQEAQVWKGACELYQKRLEEHTKTASKHETAKQVLRIGAATVTMMGSVAAGCLKAANFPDTYISKDAKAANAKNVHELKQLEGVKNPSPEQVERMKSLTEKTEAFDKRVEDAKKAGRALKQQEAALTLAVSAVNGGIAIADTALDREKDRQKRGWKIAEACYGVCESLAINSFGMWAANAAKSDPDYAGTQDFKNRANIIKCSMQAGFKAGKIVFRIQELATAKDDGTRKKAAMAIVDTIADVIAVSFAAADQKRGTKTDGDGNIVTDDKGKKVFETGDQAKWAKMGAYIKTAIKGSARLGDLMHQITVDAKGGKAPNPAMLLSSLGFMGLATASMATFDTVSDKTRKDHTGKTDEDGVYADETFYTETAKQQNARLDKAGQDLNKIADQGAALQKLIGTMPQNIDVLGIERQIAETMKKQEEDQKKAEISKFQESLKDPKKQAEILGKINQECDEQVAALEKLIEEASASPDDLQDEEKAKRAMAAVDKLIAEAAACNMRWNVITGMTNGGVSMLVAALPVAGLAASLTKLATDTAILIRRSYHLNRWRKNLALTFNNGSVYGPAIQSRLTSAKVQVSEQAARVVFDAVGVAADSLKLADATGMGAVVGAVGHGLEIGNSMARALTEYGFKMRKEHEIVKGWKTYKKARANPGDRKLARKAMTWNSTLSKCVIAYGIVIDGDPIAKEVGRSCGLTPEILADQKDVCPKVVKYFETLYSDDPVVLRRIPIVKSWHPGSPTLTLDSWARFKAAALAQAVPPLHPDSGKTATLDKALIELAAAIGKEANYSLTRDSKFPDDPLGANRRGEAYRGFLESALKAIKGVKSAVEAYQPKNGPCPEDVDPKDRWMEGLRHDGMNDIAVSLIAQAAMLEGEIEVDIAELDAMGEDLAGEMIGELFDEEAPELPSLEPAN